MENKIFAIESTFWKAIAITEHELWLSQDKVRDLEKFEKGIQKAGLLKSSYAYPLTSVSQISFNEASESINVRYQNEKGKEKKLNIKFENKDLSNEFGEYLGNKLKLTKSQKQEKQLKPLLLNIFYVVVSIVVTVLFATMDDTDDLTDGGTARQRGKRAFVKLIVDTIGQTGVIIIGFLATTFFLYQLYNRYKNPSSEIVFQR